MLFGGLMHAGSVPVFALVMLLFMPIAVECVCPWCFGGLPSCTYDSNKKCPCDTTISENIALVAAVSSATAIAGGKYFKMPGVLAAKYLRMFTSASLAALLRLCLKSTAGTDFELLATTRLRWLRASVQMDRHGLGTAWRDLRGTSRKPRSRPKQRAERRRHDACDRIL